MNTKTLAGRVTRPTLVTFVALLAMTLGACQPRPTGSPPPPAVCASFAGDVDDTPMGAQSTRDGFEFRSLDPAFPPVINQMAPGVVGLAFGDGGLEIKLPATASSVTLDAGAWAGPVAVEALDAAGAVVDSATIPNQNALSQFQLTGSDIAVVTLKEGGNEGLLVRICTGSPGPLPTSSQTASAPPTDPPAGCVSFGADVDDTDLGVQFMRNGFEFRSLDPSRSLLTNLTDGLVGLVTPDGGLEVTLPAESSAVRLDAGAWAEAVSVEARDALGTVVDSLTIPHENTVRSFRAAGPGITTLTLTEGQNEGLLVGICAEP